MTYGELEKKLTDILSQPDSALANVRPLLDEIKVDYESILTLTQAKEKNEARIRDLQDTNMKLFLAQSGAPASKDSEEELTGQDAIDAFVEELNKEE